MSAQYLFAVIFCILDSIYSIGGAPANITKGLFDYIYTPGELQAQGTAPSPVPSAVPGTQEVPKMHLLNE